MGFSDKLKEYGDKAKDAVVERKDQINEAVETAGMVADKRTGGRYRDKILKATQTTQGYVERVTDDRAASGETTSTAEPPPEPRTPPAAPTPPEPRTPPEAQTPPEDRTPPAV